MLEELTSIVEAWPGVVLDIKWENHLCFNVADKMFMITSPDVVPVNASFKVSAEKFDEWVGRVGCTPAPYLARYKWIRLDDISRFSKEEWTEILKEAYAEISAKLPARLKKEFGIE